MNQPLTGRGGAGHACPFPTCTVQVPSHMLACGRHWYRLPVALRNEIWRTWRAGDAEAHAELLVRAQELYDAMTDGAS